MSAFHKMKNNFNIPYKTTFKICLFNKAKTMSKNKPTRKHFTRWNADSTFKDFSRFLWKKTPVFQRIPGPKIQRDMNTDFKNLFLTGQKHEQKKRIADFQSTGFLSSLIKGSITRPLGQCYLEERRVSTAASWTIFVIQVQKGDNTLRRVHPTANVPHTRSY